jgi:hypothetical protein
MTKDSRKVDLWQAIPTRRLIHVRDESHRAARILLSGWVFPRAFEGFSSAKCLPSREMAVLW